MYCANCGEKLLEGAKFCATCGTPITSVSSDNGGVVRTLGSRYDDEQMMDERNNGQIAANRWNPGQAFVNQFKLDYEKQENLLIEELGGDSEKNPIGIFKIKEKINNAELGRKMAVFIARYELPDDADVYAQFLLYAIPMSNESSWDTEDDGYEYLMEAWDEKVQEVSRKAQVLFPDDVTLMNIREVYGLKDTVKKRGFFG